ncbi:hypothetical protein CMI37_39300 [Candidatus Pacearchaeota archaeon]|nr:hypothetical protein [Candidatus Pacearchaeota archaeon]|tara:strand:+ start:9318 stop:10103 length:786 start_codon:yes stop_codon:yes gene_type:complete
MYVWKGTYVKEVKMEIMNIIPGKFVEEYDSHDGGHMLFAHLVGKNGYTRTYKKMKGTKILDNSWWELRKNLPIKTLIQKAHMIEADVLTLPDFFIADKKFYEKIRKCLKLIEKLDKNIKVMGVVKGTSLKEELNSFDYFNSLIGIDWIAVPYPVRVWDEWRRPELINMIDKLFNSRGFGIEKPVHLFGVNNLETLKSEKRYYVQSADTTLAFKCGYFNIKLPIHPSQDPKRPKDYFEIKKINKKQEECIKHNLKWMSDFKE